MTFVMMECAALLVCGRLRWKDRNTRNSLVKPALHNQIKDEFSTARSVKYPGKVGSRCLCSTTIKLPPTHNVLGWRHEASLRYLKT